MAASTSSSSSFSSSSSIQHWLHDVFLSFRGTDTRTNFTSHLLAALDRQGFSTFRDDTKLRRGEHISSELVKSIKESRVSILVFSKKYATSRWCLDELVEIMECKKKFNQIVLPIFYDVDPSEVRGQLRSYSEAFSEHEDLVKEGRFSMERVQSWREALTKAANLSGYDLQHMANGDEAKLISEIVKDIMDRLDKVYIDVADYPVGIELRVQQLRELLKLGSDDEVRIVAIWGVGGIGKTTIAKATFNCIRNKFEGSSFLADVSQTSKILSGVVKLQEQFLSNILMNETYNLDNYHHGIEVIKQKIGHRRVLLVLDDIDDVQQLKRLGINRSFFCPGSRIIVTTRNMSSIASLQVDEVYSPNELNADESLKLYSWNAFKTDYPEEGYQLISNEIVAYSEGLPLVLEVLGSYFWGKSIAEWQSDSDKLKIIPNGDIQRMLKISFDDLYDKNKELFLDIAFFFIGKAKDFTVKVLEDSGLFPECGIGELARRCLVKVDTWGIKRLRMHDVLRDMGKEIVRQQSLKEFGERSRLWYKEEVLQVLRDCSGTKAIEGISLDLPTLNNEHVNTNGFANMRNLRVLHLNYLQRLSGNYITMSRNLKWLCWHGYPLAYIPNALYMENLVAIDLRYSKLKQVWKGHKRLDKLRFLNLSHSYHLIITPDFSGLKSLEILSLNDCTSLVKVPNSIGCLDKLQTLNVANCINLLEVPWTSVFMLKSLERLNFSGCPKLENLAECKEGVSMFWQRLKKRQVNVPIPMVSIVSCLRELNFANCKMDHLPNNIGSLITLNVLNLSGNIFSSLPSSISHLSRLKFLRLDGCLQLTSLVHLPNHRMCISANNCISLETVSVGNLHSSLTGTTHLEFWNCPKLDSRSVSNSMKRDIEMHHQEAGYHLSFPGGELPYDMQFEAIDPRRLSFVVPPLVGKKVKGIILCLVVSYYPRSVIMAILNKGKIIRHLWIHIRSKLRGDGDHVLIIYEPIYVWGFTMEGGDDVILYPSDDDETSLDFYVKRFGVDLIYEDDDSYLQSKIAMLDGYTDGNMAGDVDSRKSTSGYLITFAGAAISWQSGLQKCVALSTTQAEYIAVTEACKEILWLKKFFNNWA